MPTLERLTTIAVVAVLTAPSAASADCGVLHSLQNYHGADRQKSQSSPVKDAGKAGDAEKGDKSVRAPDSKAMR